MLRSDFGHSEILECAEELDGIAKGRISVALLNFGAEKRDHILLIESWGGIAFFFFFFGFGGPKGGGGGGGPGFRALSESLESVADDMFV